MEQLIQKAIDLGSACGPLDAAKLISAPSTIKAYLQDEAAKARQDMVGELRLALEDRRCGGTTDGWTEGYHKTHYVTLTMSYINDSWVLIVRNIFTVGLEPDETSNADTLKSLMLKHLLDMGIQAELVENVVFVTDGGSDVVKSLEDYVRLYCTAHALNVVVRTSLSVKYSSIIQRALIASPEAKNIIDAANSWVKEARKALPGKHSLLSKLRCSQTTSDSHLPPLKSLRDHHAAVS
jgi:hypothetical protein